MLTDSPYWKFGPGDASQSDEVFQKLLLELSRAAFQSSDSSQLIRSFCALTRAFFHASGAYFWTSLLRTVNSSEPRPMPKAGTSPFVASADATGDASIAMDAVQRRRPFFVNHLDAARYPWLASIQAHAALAAPLLVSGEVVGAITFLQSAPGAGFRR